jgi:DNA repair photolyase
MSYSLIYEPKGRAREYAALACNIYRGCDHGCEYCYAPSATQRQREDFAESQTRGPDFLARLSKEAHKRQAAGLGGSVLLCFTCDPYQHLDAELGLTREAIQILHATGHDVQILTKGGTRALRDLDLFGPEDAFATTLTFLDEARSLEWEAGAALPGDRIQAIRAFHEAGIPTWVSLEPVLDPATALNIIRGVYPFVDLFKIGKLNYHPLAKSINWTRFGINVIALLESLGRPYYIKRDLAMLLPPGYADQTEPMPQKQEGRKAQMSLF